MECEICCEEEKFQYDQDSLIDHLINQHLAKRNEAIENHIKTIRSMESQLTEKDKDHDIKINAVNEKLKIAEENVKAMKTEIEKQNNKQKQNVHEEEKLFKCDICDAQYTSNHALEGHVKSDHVKNKKRKFEIEDKEAEKRKRFYCEICDASFSQNGGLTRHIKTIHEGVKSYKCKLCGEDFSHSQELERHNNSKHVLKKKTFQCIYCNLPLSRKDKKKEHEMICHKIKRKEKVTRTKKKTNKEST